MPLGCRVIRWAECQIVAGVGRAGKGVGFGSKEVLKALGIVSCAPTCHKVLKNMHRVQLSFHSGSLWHGSFYSSLLQDLEVAVKRRVPPWVINWWLYLERNGREGGGEWGGGRMGLD